jgi:hypothetical protein
MQPRSPIYVPSRGRAASCLTARQLDVPFTLVVEPHEAEDYAKQHPGVELVVLPESNKGIAYARRSIKEHSKAAGHASHWQVDDNIRWFGIRDDKNRKELAHLVLHAAEVELEPYVNVAIASLCQTTFAWTHDKPYSINRQAYSCVWVRNDVPCTWRDELCEDTDYSLQVLDAGWCTIIFNRLLMDKAPSCKMSGGNTEMYLSGGREARNAGLLKRWPGVFQQGLRYGKQTILPSNIWRTFPQRPLRHGEEGERYLF